MNQLEFIYVNEELPWSHTLRGIMYHTVGKFGLRYQGRWKKWRPTQIVFLVDGDSMRHAVMKEIHLPLIKLYPRKNYETCGWFSSLIFSFASFHVVNGSYSDTALREIAYIDLFIWSPSLDQGSANPVVAGKHRIVYSDSQLDLQIPPIKLPTSEEESSLIL
jgi:hypothetical protein